MSTASTEIDQLFSVLTHPTRRHLLLILDAQETNTLSGTDLLDALTERLDKSRQTLQVHLHHIHAPKLAAAGVILYDENTGDVQVGPQFSAAVQVLTTLE